ncbi:MAG: hypothetical protein O8C63_13340 [Candidatus Methanoperedens sp.]|nr:hypothetical protein [Candidatus Methanoperedens sp.]
MMKGLSELEKKINVVFRDKNLLQQAVVHDSYINENPGFKPGHNERLEFLGDAVLELVVREFLYNKFPNPEGDLTKYKEQLVKNDMLPIISNKLNLEDYLLMGKGEYNNKAGRQKLLADTLEALIGAIYLDQGYEKVRDFITNNILNDCKNILK